MSGNGYKALGFVVWKGGMWYLKRRYGLAKRVGTGVGVLALGAVAAGAIAAAQRRSGAH